MPTMTDRDRLAADIRKVLKWAGMGDFNVVADIVADRLIALGWTRLDEDRLARAMHRHMGHADRHEDFRGCSWCSPEAADLAKAYREDAG